MAERIKMEPRSSSGPASAGPGGGTAAVGVSVPEVPVPDVIVADRRWHALVRGSGRVVARAARLGGGAGSVLLTTDRAVRRLNARHRGEDHATNVLTFEAGPGTGGDIVLALGVVRREAGAAGRRPAHHLAHLVLHGALHLRGHDHHGAGEARRMELREAWLLHRMGVPNPWRVGGRAAGPGIARSETRLGARDVARSGRGAAASGSSGGAMVRIHRVGGTAGFATARGPGAGPCGAAR